MCEMRTKWVRSIGLVSMLWLVGWFLGMLVIPLDTLPNLVSCFFRYMNFYVTFYTS